MNKFFSILFITLFLVVNDVKSQWNLVGSIPAAEVSCVNVYQDTVFAGAGNLIYISTDNGNTWIPTSIVYNEIDFISTILKIDNAIFAGTYTYGIYKSTDNGNSWFPFNNGLGGILTIEDLVQRGDSIYAGTIGNSIYTAKISGDSWSTFNSNIPMNNAGSVYSLYNFNGRLITGSGVNANLYYNDQGTINWNEIQFAVFNPQGTAMLAMINEGSILYGVGSQGLYKSTDRGLNWEYFNPDLGLVELGALFIDKQKVFAMLSKPGKTYYFTYNNNINQWALFDYQPGVTTYNFIITKNKIFAAGLGGLYYRDLEATSIKDRNEFPKEFILHQNYPNPFNPTTVIQYTIDIRQFVTLKVYDVLGNEIIILVNEEKGPGTYEVKLLGNKLPSGVYFYRLETGKFSETRKMALLR